MYRYRCINYNKTFIHSIFPIISSQQKYGRKQPELNITLNKHTRTIGMYKDVGRTWNIKYKIRIKVLILTSQTL